MSDGKRSTKSDVVILSIKPRRPEYSPDKKYISIKVSLQEWDKLDAYYRGQILTLKKQVSRKSSRKISTSRHKRSSSSSLSRRSNSSGRQLTELFGDENIPWDDDSSVTLSDDEENKYSEKERYSSKKREHDNTKSSAKSQQTKTEVLKQAKQEDDENYLSVPRDNFVIEFAIGLKKRTPVHTTDPGFINPIKVEPYKPPVALGFNGVHIQKILYHKSDGINHTSPTTTAPTPEKPPENGPISPLLISGNESKRKSSNTCDKSDNGIDNGNHNSQQPKSKVNVNYKKPYNNKLQNESSITSPTVSMKRKLGHSDSANGSVSSTTALSDECGESRPKKPTHDKTTRDKLPSFNTTANVNRDVVEKNTCPSPMKSLSITDKIIEKAKQMPPELKERERRRRLESQKRKMYALAKVDEQKLLDSVDVSMKAFEMILNHSVLSPIRSP